MCRFHTNDKEHGINIVIADFMNLSKVRSVIGLNYKEHKEEKCTVQCTYIKWKYNNRVLDVHEGDFYDRTTINVYTNFRTTNQKFKLTHRGNGYHSIDIMGYSLDIEDNEIRSGTRVMLWRHNGGDNQLWKLDPLSSDSGSYIIRSKANENLVMDVDTSYNPDRLFIRSYTGGFRQIFELEDC